jgi:ABC-type sulfate transport system permease component
MWYWIIAGSIFLTFEILAFLSFTPLKNKYGFFKFINDCCASESVEDISSIAYTILAATIALLFPLVISLLIVYIVSEFINYCIKSILKKN